MRGGRAPPLFRVSAKSEAVTSVQQVWPEFPAAYFARRTECLQFASVHPAMPAVDLNQEKVSAKELPTPHQNHANDQTVAHHDKSGAECDAKSDGARQIHNGHAADYRGCCGDCEEKNCLHGSDAHPSRANDAKYGAIRNAPDTEATANPRLGSGKSMPKGVIRIRVSPQ
jgi:hypothetical protein